MTEIIILRLVHILSAIFWLGSILMMTFFLLPSLSAAGPAISGPIMMGLRKRRLLVFTPLSALLTILSGLRLLMIDARGIGMMGSPMLRAFTIAGMLAILAFVIGLIFALPTSRKLMAMSTMVASGEQDRQRLAADVAALQRRMAMASSVIAALMILAAAGMAIARYQ